MDGNEDKEGELGGASASGSAEAPPSLVGRRCVVDRLFGGREKKKKVSEGPFARSDRSIGGSEGALRSERTSRRIGLPDAHL